MLIHKKCLHASSHKVLAPQNQLSKFSRYEEKKQQVLELKSTNKSADYGDAWKATDAWGNDDTTASSWPVKNNWSDETVPADIENIPGVYKYKAIYGFTARNNDEISFQPGDIIHVRPALGLQPLCAKRISLGARAANWGAWLVGGRDRGTHWMVSGIVCGTGRWGWDKRS